MPNIGIKQPVTMLEKVAFLNIKINFIDKQTEKINV